MQYYECMVPKIFYSCFLCLFASFVFMIIRLCPPIYPYVHFSKIDMTTKNSGSFIKLYLHHLLCHLQLQLEYLRNDLSVVLVHPKQQKYYNLDAQIAI